MALTITNHLIRSADTPHTADLGDGGRTVTWLPGRVFTEGQAAATEIAEAASQIPAGCDLEVHDEGFWSPVDARAWPARPYRTRRHYAATRGARGRVMAWPAAGYCVAAAGGLGGDEDEQA
jgi:hypothetical protein